MVKLIPLVPAIVLLALGSEGLFHAVRGRHDVVLSCEEFARARPSSIRVRVTGCEPDYAHAAYRESGNTIEELFLPVRSAGQNTRPASIVVATSDPAAIAIAQRVLGGTGSNDQSLAAMKRVADYLGVSIAVDGVVRAGWMERLRSRRILSRLSDSVASDAVVVDLRAVPNIWRPALALAAGLALALVVWLLMRRAADTRVTSTSVPAAPGPVIASSAYVEPPISAPAVVDAVAIAESHAPPTSELASGNASASQPTPEPEPAREIETTVEHQPVAQAPAASSPESDVTEAASVEQPRVTVMLPKLLLLNVDVLSGPEAVESAPPLGKRHDVGAILCGVIPDLEFIDGTRVLGRDDGSIRLDIGAQDMVATVVVEVHGQAGIALIKELLLMTGWRAFAPKTGLFVSADDLESLAALAGSWKQEAQR